MLEAIKKGTAAFTVVQQPWGQGYLAIWVLKQMVEGKKPTTLYVDTGTTIIDKSNVDTYMDAVIAGFWENIFPIFEKEVMK